MSNEPNAEGSRTNPSQRSAEEEARYARRMSPRQIVFLLMLLLVLLLVALAVEIKQPIHFTGAGFGPTPMPILTPIIASQSSNASNVSSARVPASASSQAPVCSPPGKGQAVSSRFISFYNQYGGLLVFGRPISSEIIDSNKHTIQWFERARLEEWPELKNTSYAIQAGRIGAEFTSGITFPKQAFFVSQPEMRYFAETNHGVRNPFLSFWEQYGGLTVFGYPLSDEVNENLDDGQIHRVQYFERARLEYHPAADQQVQIGLLGHALCLNNSKPKLVTPIAPTPVPVQ